MNLSTIVFHMDCQPDFEILKQRGWVHPMGLGHELLERSLVKTFGDYQIQIVRHTGGWNYTEAFISDIPKREIMKKGEGKGMTRGVALDLINKFYTDLEGGEG